MFERAQRTQEVPQDKVGCAADDRVWDLAHEQARDERRPAVDPARPFARLPQASERVHFEDDGVHPHDGDEEEEEDAEHAVLERDDGALAADEEERQADDEGDDGRREKLGVREARVAVVVLRDALRQEDALPPDGSRRRRRLAQQARRWVASVDRRTELDELLFDGAVLGRRRPALRQDVQVVDLAEVLVRNVDARLADVEEEVGRVAERRCVGLVDARVAREERDGVVARAKVDLLAAALQQEQVVKDAKRLGRLCE